MKLLPKTLLFVILILSLPAFAIEPIKIDLNHIGRQDTEVHEPGYTSWRIKGGSKTESITVNGVTFTLTSTGDSIGILASHWFAAGFPAAKLVSDGVRLEIKDGALDLSNNIRIQLKIEGLPNGIHSLQSYHNQADNPSTNTFSPMDIYFRGELIKTSFEPSVRALQNTAAARFFHEFEITNGEAAVFEYKLAIKPGANNRTLIINGIEVGTKNSDDIATHPIPNDRDEHVFSENGSFTLLWTGAASGAVSHDVYFGNNLENVKNADKSSPEFKGNQTNTSFTVSNLYSLEKYYWRIDEINANGITTKGDVWYFRRAQLAFPGAEGYGRFAIGGRGGMVVKVTNLNDSGEGSLRDAVENPKYDGIPRTIIFDVSGQIKLNGRLSVNKPYVTIAGQTAPGKGICISGHAFGIGGVNDVVLRQLRLRVGADDTTDGMGMSGSDHCIIDHCSISWSKDEATSSRNAKNITFSRNLISEPLNRAGHKNYPEGTGHGYAGSIGGDISSYHHNLLVHSAGRNWSLAGGLDKAGFYQGRLDIFNNVIYNWQGRTTDGGAHEVNFVNNYYKPGPETGSSQVWALNAQWDGFPGTQKYYTEGNIIEGRKENISDPRNACRSDTNNPDPWSDVRFFPSYAVVHSAKEAFKHVISDAGAISPLQDDQDLRVIRETLEGSWTYRGSYNAPDGTRGIIDHQNDVGGWENYGTEARAADFDSDNDGLPDWWETDISRTNPDSPANDFSDTNADPDCDGFTHLDDYLNWLDLAHHTIETADYQIDLTKLATGFSKSPIFSIKESKNCNVKLENGIATPTYVIGSSKLACFTFQCTDDDGGTPLIRKVNLYFPNVQTGLIKVGSEKNLINYSYSGKNDLYISISNDSSLEMAEIVCFDISGKDIFQKQAFLSSKETVIDLSSLAIGIYAIKVMTGNGEQNFKIIKNQ